MIYQSLASIFILLEDISGVAHYRGTDSPSSTKPIPVNRLTFHPAKCYRQSQEDHRNDDDDRDHGDFSASATRVSGVHPPPWQMKAR